jgi:hypothetical protein
VRRNTSLPPPGLECVTSATTEGLPPPSAGLTAPQDTEAAARDRTAAAESNFDIYS